MQVLSRKRTTVHSQTYARHFQRTDPVRSFNFEIPEQFPAVGISAKAAKAIVTSETWTDANPMLNLSSFVTTFCEPVAKDIHDASMFRNFADPGCMTSGMVRDRPNPTVLRRLDPRKPGLSPRIGSFFHKRRQKPEEDMPEDFGVILTGTLTLLGVIIGFTFSMAIGRYEQRKNYEKEEVNAIGTEYVRADLLPAADVARTRALLRNYLDQRILFYETRDEQQLRRINANTAQMQSELWSAVQAPAAVQPTPVVALAISGMNDVLNSQGYTQAAWWNRIPLSAWGLMAAIAICCNFLIGYGVRHAEAEGMLTLVIPFVGPSRSFS
jgi:hypothetical protein